MRLRSDWRNDEPAGDCHFHFCRAADFNRWCTRQIQFAQVFRELQKLRLQDELDVEWGRLQRNSTWATEHRVKE